VQTFGTQLAVNGNSYMFPAGRHYSHLGTVADGTHAYAGFDGGYGNTSGSCTFILQPGINNTTQEAGTYVAGELQGLASTALTFGHLTAASSVSGNATKTERMRIDSSGRLGLGTSTPSSYNADAADLVIGSSGSNGLTIVSGTTNNGNIFFADGTSGNDQLRGFIQYNHQLNFLNIGTNATSAIRIDSSQRVGIGTTSPQTSLVVSNGGAQGLEIGWDGSTAQFLQAYNRSGSTWIPLRIQGSDIRFNISGSTNEKARIDSSGRLLVGTSTSPSLTDGQYAKIHLVGNTAGATGDSVLNLGRGVLASSGIAAQTSLGILQFTDSAGAAHATIKGVTDGVTGSNDYPGRLVFSTTADGASSPTERMRINSAGNISMGTTGNIARLDVRMTGAATNNAVYVERTSVSTAGQGVYSYMVSNSGLISSSYALYGAYSASTNSPGGGVIGVLSSVYGILGYFDNSNSWAVYANGSMYSTGTYQGSDSRLKDIVEPISGGILDKLAGIQPVKYRWKENTDQRESVGDGIQIGLIAQEVEEHFPELVKEITHNCPINPENLEDGQFDSSCSLNHELGTTKTLEYQHLTAVLVEALKEAKTRIETLEAKVTALENP
jgi:hypothetical protein